MQRKAGQGQPQHQFSRPRRPAQPAFRRFEAALEAADFEQDGGKPLAGHLECTVKAAPRLDHAFGGRQAIGGSPERRPPVVETAPSRPHRAVTRGDSWASSKSCRSLSPAANSSCEISGWPSPSRRCANQSSGDSARRRPSRKVGALPTSRSPSPATATTSSSRRISATTAAGTAEAPRTRLPLRVTTTKSSPRRTRVRCPVPSSRAMRLTALANPGVMFVFCSIVVTSPAVKRRVFWFERSGKSTKKCVYTRLQRVVALIGQDTSVAGTQTS